LILSHAYEVFWTLYIILNNTPIVENPRSEHVLLVEHVDTTSEKLVDDLVVCAKHVVLCD
jgi:hypothetical protein